MQHADDRWSEGLRKRDPAALEGLMEAYGSRIHALVSCILEGTGGRMDAEECASDVFVAAWNRIEEFDPQRGSFSTWLFVLAKYKALDYRRKLADRPVPMELSERTPDGRDDPESELLQKAAIADLLRLLDSLGEVDRTIFYKRYFYYEPLETIAKDLQLTAKAVENRLRRGRAELKRRMLANKEGWT